MDSATKLRNQGRSFIDYIYKYSFCEFSSLVLKDISDAGNIV